MDFTATRRWKLSLPDDPAGCDQLRAAATAAGLDPSAGGSTTGNLIAWLIQTAETGGISFLPVPVLVEEDPVTWAAAGRPGVGGSVPPFPRPGTSALAAALAAADTETESHYGALLLLADTVRAYLAPAAALPGEFTVDQHVEFRDRTRGAEWQDGTFIRLDGGDALVTDDEGRTVRTPAGRVRLPQPRRTS